MEEAYLLKLKVLHGKAKFRKQILMSKIFKNPQKSCFSNEKTEYFQGLILLPYYQVYPLEIQYQF